MDEKSYINDDQENISLGLEASDTDDYHVNDGAWEWPDADSGRDGRLKRPGPGPRRTAPAFLLGIAFCIAVILICTYMLGLAKIIPQKTYRYYRDLDNAYGKYYEIMKMIGEDPLAENEVKGIDDDALKEIVAGTGDPYAQYFTAEEYARFMKRYEGNYVGIGVGVIQEDDKIVIKSVFSDSPAEDAGLKAEDVIVSVDGKIPEDVDDAIDMIGGEAGTKVEVAVDRDGEEISFTMNRAKIETDSVGYSAMKEHPDIGYIYIASFARDTADDFKMAVRDLEAEGCDKFIIDLRSNGGGLTNSSMEIADYLLPECTIMTEKTKDGKETVHKSKSGSADLDCVVLVNGDTASASEILTAALQDNEAATVIGTNTYGKGVTQTTHMYKDGSAVKLTVTEYFRPDGGKVNGVGITPDIEADGADALDKAVEVLEK